MNSLYWQKINSAFRKILALAEIGAKYFSALFVYGFIPFVFGLATCSAMYANLYPGVPATPSALPIKIVNDYVGTGIMLTFAWIVLFHSIKRILARHFFERSK